MGWSRRGGYDVPCRSSVGSSTLSSAVPSRRLGSVHPHPRRASPDPQGRTVGVYEYPSVGGPSVRVQDGRVPGTTRVTWGSSLEIPVSVQLGTAAQNVCPGRPFNDPTRLSRESFDPCTRPDPQGCDVPTVTGLSVLGRHGTLGAPTLPPRVTVLRTTGTEVGSPGARTPGESRCRQGRRT